MRIPWFSILSGVCLGQVALADAGCRDEVGLLQVNSVEPMGSFSFAGGGQVDGQLASQLDPMGSQSEPLKATRAMYPTANVAAPSVASWENKRGAGSNGAEVPRFAGGGDMIHPGDHSLAGPLLTGGPAPMPSLEPAAPRPVRLGSLEGDTNRGRFANGAMRFAGGETGGTRPSELKLSSTGVESAGVDHLPRASPPVGHGATVGEPVLASGMPPSVAGPSQMLSSDEEIYSVNCGISVIQPKAWHFTFRPPNTGDFNIPITVHQSAQKSYQIARVKVSVSADLDNWQPFRLRLIGPSRTSILLKESGSSECADLRCDFTETNSCHSCTRPMETLSAFTGESALGTWILSFEDAEQRKRTSAMAWAALKITWSCEPPLDQKPQ